MSNILNLSNDISLTKNILIRSGSSVGGYTRTARGGPSLFAISAELPLLTEEQHLIVQKEFLSDDGFGEGILFKLDAKIPAKALLTPAPIINYDEDSALFGFNISIDPNDTDGNKVTIVGLDTTVDSDGLVNPSSAKAGDFIQFSSNSKVYQVKQDAISNSTGELELFLNQGVVTNLVNNEVIRLGSDVQFKLQLTSRPIVTAIPQSATTNLYQYNTFNFRETL